MKYGRQARNSAREGGSDLLLRLAGQSGGVIYGSDAP